MEDTLKKFIIVCHTIMALALFFAASYFIINKVHWGWTVTFLMIGQANASNICNILKDNNQNTDKDNYY